MTTTILGPAHPAFGADATSNELPLLDSTLHWVEHGEGDPVVLLHGNPTSSFLWRHVFARLRGHGRLLAPDLIGFGRSGKPAIDYDLADHQRYLDAWLDALDLRDATLVLHDYGALFGLDWARRNDDRVARVVLLEPVLRSIDSRDLPEPVRAWRAIVTRPGDGERFVLDDDRFLGELFPASFAEPLAPEDLEQHRAPFPTPESRRPVLVFPRALPVDGRPADTIERIDRNAAWLVASATPKLLLTFEPGALLTPRILAWAREHVRALEIRPAGRGGHFVQEEEPEAIATAITDWIGR